MRPIIITALLLALAPVAFAGPQSDYNVGSNAAPWLNIPASARSAALAEAGTVLTGDLMSSLAENPASLADFRSAQLAFGENLWLQDTSLQQAGLGWQMGDAGVLGLGYTYMNYGDINRYNIINDSAVPEGSFNPYGMATRLEYGLRVNRWMALGLGGKWVHETIDSLASDGFAGDAGALLTPLEGLNLAVAGQNLGGTLHGASLPAEVRAGASYEAPLGRDNGITVLGEAAVPTADGAATSAGGALEYAYAKTLFLRGGWRWQGGGSGSSDNGGLSAGVGLRLMLLTVDYAYVDKGSLGTSSQFSIAASF
jgi:hypothetical protein